MSAWQYIPWTVLAAALIAACWTDWRQRRIPNSLSATTFAVVLLLQACAPNGNGFFSPHNAGATGLLAALAAAALAFFAFLVLHLLRVLGAGDVKLMAPVGAFFGNPSDVMPLLASIAIAGGVLAVLRMGPRARRERIFYNLHLIWIGIFYRRHLAGVAVFDPQRDSADRLPYAFAIALGCLAYAALLRGGLL